MSVEQQNVDFDWNSLISEDAKRKKIPNSIIYSKYKDRVYNHENYALEYYEALFNYEMPSCEPIISGAYKIKDIVRVANTEISVIIEGGFECIIEMNSEKGFLNTFGWNDPIAFLEYIQTEQGAQEFINNEYYLVVEQLKPYLKGSISKGEILKIKDEFYAQIKKQSEAYYGTIVNKNQGGFLINVQGVFGFLPGSLAATNIVRDFDDMIGKSMPVMVEDYLEGSDTFVFSYKKYVKTILPQKTRELEIGAQFHGIATGVTKFGVFIEFDDIFTGLLHTSKMSDTDKEKFANRQFKAGDSISFWIQEITYDNKIILTSNDPSLYRKELEEFKKSNGDSNIDGQIINVKPFGLTVRLNSEMVGVISGKELKSKKNNYTVGDTISVKVGYVGNNNKLYLKFAE